MGWDRTSVWSAALLMATAAGVRASDTELADAAERRDWATVLTLVARGADVDAAQADGMTALHWAAYHDDIVSARFLVGSHADAKKANRYGVPPLASACSNGDGPMVELLLAAGADSNAPLAGGETPLMTAARTGKVEAVKALLAHGAEVDARERRGQTALMWAAAEGNEQVVETLLAAKADLHASLASGFTPLDFAVREGRAGVVRILLKAGADVNRPMEPRKAAGRAPERGATPLILAVENGHFDLAVQLIEAGADPNESRTGYTPLHMMIWVRKPNRGDGLDGDPPPLGSGTMTSLAFVRELVSRGADVNARLARGGFGRGPVARTGATPFLMAAFTADVPLMRLLLDLGADPKIADARGCTALMAASGVGSLAPEEEAGTEPEAYQAVLLALELGGDVNAVNLDGETAMHGAAYKNLPSVVHLLGDRGARPDVWNRKNKRGWSPLMIAEGYRPGNFKPSASTAAAIRSVMAATGVSEANDEGKPRS